MFSLQRYRALFAVPGLAQAFAASVLGRLPIGIAGLSILLFVQSTTRSFAVAGTASALYVLGLALVAPVIGRWLDRVGPRPVLSVCAIVYPAALFVLVALVARGAPVAWIAASALIAGSALPPVSICMRALFPRVVSDLTLLPTAYSLDSALIELIFIAGPALVAACVAAGHPGFAVALAAVCAALGAAVFLRARIVRAWQRPKTARARGAPGPLRRPRLALVYAVTLCYAAAFGLFEVGVTAHAAAAGAPAMAGIALALASMGSACGALAYGGRHWAAPLPRQFVAALVALAGCLLVMTPIGGMVLFVAACVVAGVPMATVMAIQAQLVSRLTPHEMLAESFTWGTTCLLGGISAGLAAGGLLAQRYSPACTLGTAAAAALLGAAIAVALRRA